MIVGGNELFEKADDRSGDRAGARPEAHGALRGRCGISMPWLVVSIGIVCFIWGNSLLPADDSAAASGSVLELLRSLFAFLGFGDAAWLTEHVVRKLAHFCEYLALGFSSFCALRPHRRAGQHGRRRSYAVLAAALAAVPAIDETIQRFVDGRCGQFSDVLLDMCGAATGVLLAWGVAALVRKRRSPGGSGDGRGEP